MAAGPLRPSAEVARECRGAIMLHATDLSGIAPDAHLEWLRPSQRTPGYTDRWSSSLHAGRGPISATWSPPVGLHSRFARVN